MVVSPGPSVIVNATPRSGLLVGRPVCQVWVDGRLLPTYFSVSGTRGLDQDMASVEIVVPHPLPDWIRYWSRVSIVAGIPPTDTANGQFGPLERFTGFVTSVGQQLWPPAKTIRCQDIMTIAASHYVPAPLAIGDYFDSEAITRILFGCAYNPSVYASIDPVTSGTGTKLANIAEANLFWEEGETGLEAIQKVDEVSLGWRTYATAGGLITRRQIVTDPSTQLAVWNFAEGRDVLDGSVTAEVLDPKNEITLAGFDTGGVTASLDPAVDPFDWLQNSYWKRFRALQTQAAAIGIIDPQAVAIYVLSQVGKRVIKVQFSTFLDIPFQGQEVFHLVSERMEIDQKFWTQNVQFTVDEDGTWTQTITGIGNWETKNRHLVGPPIAYPVGQTPGADVTVPTPTTTTPPTAADFLPDFVIVGIDLELAGNPADPGDHGAAHYIVAVSDISTNVQVLAPSRQWTASGPGAVPTDSGPAALPTWNVAFTNLTGAVVTLTLSDGLGHSVSVSKPVDTSGVPIRTRKLFSLTPSTYEAGAGTTWVQQSPVLPSKVQALGAGPVWGADHYVAISADGLATPPVEHAALPPGEDVSCIWIHQRNSNMIAVGGSAGSIAITTDRGATWTLKTSLGEPVHGIIVSIFRETEIHVVTPSGWYTSRDQGVTWPLVRAGDFLYLELSHTRNIIVTNAGELQVAETGQVFTGYTSPIRAATSHIRRDTFYGIALDGTTWVQDTEGSLAMVPGEPIPAGSVLPGGAFRDDQFVDLVFFAAQTGGIFKTMDGFRSADGYLRLRADGLLTP